MQENENEKTDVLLARLLIISAIIIGAASCGASDDDASLGNASGDTPQGPDGDSDMDADSDADSDMDGDSDGDSDTGFPGPDKPWNEPGDEESYSDTDSGQCDIESSMTYYLSADDSNSMASPVLVRSFIRAGQLVPRELVRVHEFLNYYGFDYTAPELGDVSISAEMLENPAIPGEYDLQLAVRSRDRSNEDRLPLNLTLSVDTSGSMKGDPALLAREICRTIAGSLRSGDIVSIVSWDTSQSVLLPTWKVVGPDDSQVLTYCDLLGTIDATGATDLHAGLINAYELVRQYRSRQGINRVVLISDGRANAGVADAVMIADEAVDAEGDEIYLAGVGVGAGTTYYDTLMNVVTDSGKGAYLFVDNAEEAEAAFEERLISNLDIAVRNVRVSLTLPPSFEIVAFHGEEHSEIENEVEPQHLAPNDAMIYHQTVASCDPDFVSEETDTVIVKATYEDPETGQQTSEEVTYTLDEILAGESLRLVKGNAIVAYAEALKSLASLDGQAATDLIDTVRAKVQAASSAIDTDPELDQIDDLLEQYRLLFE